MSRSSSSDLVEAAIITDDARAVAGARVFVQHLLGGADLVDDDFLKRASKLKVRTPRRGSRRRRTVNVRRPRAWFVSLTPLDEDRYAHEEDLVEQERLNAEKSAERRDSEAGYMRWAGGSLFRAQAKPGDIVIAAWMPTSKSKPGTVYAPEPLLHRKDQGKVTHFFVEEYADRAKTAMSFSAFNALWTHLGEGPGLTVRSTRELPLELVEAAWSLWGK